MDLEIAILNEVNQTEKNQYHMMSLICVIFKKMIQTNLFIRQILRLQKRPMVTKGERCEGGIN